MKLVRLVYFSKMKDSLSMDSIHEILTAARPKNASRGITGVMSFSNGYFLQLLEGPSTPVNQLYASLMRDPRHADLTLLDYRQIESRRFEAWSMGFFIPNENQPQLLDPYSLSIDDALDCLCSVPL